MAPTEKAFNRLKHCVVQASRGQVVKATDPMVAYFKKTPCILYTTNKCVFIKPKSYSASLSLVNKETEFGF